MRDRLCVVMPVYNERDAIGDVLLKWNAELRRLGIDYEIRPYNDGSKDDSLAVMQEVAKRCGGRVVPRDKPNGGHGNTILTGYREAAADGFDWVFQIDSDDEMGPEKFGELWAARNDADFLVGIRDGRKQALPRKIMSFVSRLCVRLFYDRSVWDVNTPYRLMRVSAFRDFFEKIPLSTFAPNVILSGLAGACGLRCHEIRVPQHDRTTGEVSIKKWKLLKAAVLSFWQTISFAVCMKAVGKEGVGARVVRLGALLMCCAGIGLCALSVSRMPLVACALLAIVIMVFVKTVLPSRIFAAVADFASRRPFAAFSIVIVLGLLLRVAAYMSISDIGRLQGGDCRAFWNWAKEMTAGYFPDAKSWVAPGVWAVSIKVFGESLFAASCLNIVVQIATSGVLFLVAKGCFRSAAAGIMAAAGYFLSPLFAGFAFHMYSEHVFYLLVVLSIAALWRWRDRHSITMAVALPVLALGILWTRGEGGLVLMGMIPFLYLCELVVSADSRRSAMVGLILFAAIVSVGILVGYAVNAKYHGTKTFLCSNDNWWPRLYGSNYEHDGNITKLHIMKSGKVTNIDKELILDRYEKESGRRIELQASVCPAVLVPYIKEEIAWRWGRMSPWQIIRFVARKERHTWAQWKYIGWAKPYGRLPSSVFKAFFVIGTAIVLWRLFRMLLLRIDVNLGMSIFSLALILFCCGIGLVVAIAEAHPRYGQIATAIVFPIYGAGALSRRSAS